jgi:hypothetical protein
MPPGVRHITPDERDYRVHAFASTHPTNHLAARSLNTEFLAMIRKSPKPYCNCSANADTWGFCER